MKGSGQVRLVKPFELYVDGLLLVPGDIRLSSFEQQLADSWTEAFKRRTSGLRATTALSDFVSQLVEELEVDIVMYDTGPNIGPLNRVIVLDSDFLVVPVACDLFSVRALATLGQSLRTWILDCQTVATLAPEREDMLPGAPRFIGYIPQQFKVYGQKMAQAPSFYLRRVQKQIGSDLVNVLKKIDPALVPMGNIDAKIGQVKNFSTLVQDAQLEGSALWDVDKGKPTLKAEARTVFEDRDEHTLRRGQVEETKTEAEVGGVTYGAPHAWPADRRTINSAVRLFRDPARQSLLDQSAQNLMRALRDNPALGPFVHFIKYRVKSADSLKQKLVLKAQGRRKAGRARQTSRQKICSRRLGTSQPSEFCIYTPTK